MKWYLDRVIATCESIGGRSVVSEMTDEKTMAMWSNIYDESPSAMAKASVGPLNAAVPVDEIFSSNGTTHIKWQKYLKTVFTWAANDTMRLKYMKDGKDERDECFRRWVAMPLAVQLKYLELGSMNDTPIKTGGILDQGRRRMLTKVEYTDAYKVAVRVHQILM